MEFSGIFIHFSTIALVVSLPSIATGIGEALIGLAALKSLDMQPHARAEISRIFMLGMALTETTGVIGLVMGIMLLSPVDLSVPSSTYTAELGIALAISLSGLVVGVASSFPAQYACYSVARQPFFSQKIQMLMLITQSLMQTPIIFAFMISVAIKANCATAVTDLESLRFIAAGLCIGLGSIGPSIGLALLSKEACKSIGINRHAFNKIFSFTLLSEALIESSIIFAAIISLLILQIRTNQPVTLVTGCAFIAGAFCMGLGTLGVGISSGRVATQACKQITLAPQHYSVFAQTSLIGQVLIETNALYTLLIAFFIIAIG